MKIYIISIVAVSLFASALILLAPEGKNGGISKHLRLLTSLCILAIISEPLISFSKNILSSNAKDMTHLLTDGLTETDSESVFFESISDYSASQLDRQLTRLICEKFSFDDSDVSVTSSYVSTDEGISFSSVTVRLSGLAIFKDPRDVEGFVTALTGLPCRCTV